MRFSIHFLWLLLSGKLALGIINLPDNFVHYVGDEVDFAIPSTGTPDGYGANYLPIGLTLDPLNGTISGKLLESGDWSTMFYAFSGQSFETKSLTWKVLESGENAASNLSYHVVRKKAGQDLSGVYTGVQNLDAIDTVQGLPDGVTFNYETFYLSGAVSDPGLYEIRLSQKRGAAWFYHTLILLIDPADWPGRVSLPTTASSSIVYFKGKYYFPGSKETVSVTEDLKTWAEVVPVPGKYVSDFVSVGEVLVGRCFGGYVLSHDGDNFDFLTFPNNLSADWLIAGKNGIVAAFEESTGDQLLYSSNGLDWVEWVYPMDSISQPIVVDSDFYFYESGTFHITSEGTEWSKVKRKNHLGDIDTKTFIYGNGVFAARGWRDDEVYTSHSGEYWNLQTIRTGVEFSGIHFSDGRFFLWGRDEDDNDPDSVLTSLDGKTWSAINVGSSAIRISEVKQVHGNILVKQLAQNGAISSLDFGAPLDVPAFFVPNFLEFPPGESVYYPLNVSGSYTSLRAYGLPRGLKFDSILGVIYGTSKEEWFSSFDVIFVGENNGLSGVVERSEIYMQPGESRPPEIFSRCVTGQVGWELTDQELSFWPRDPTSSVRIIDAPAWLTTDGYDFEGIPTEAIQTSFTLEVTNLHGTKTKEIPLTIGQPVLEEVDLGFEQFDPRYFSFGKGRYFARDNFESYWSDDLVNWTATDRAMEGPGDIVEFKDRLYFVESPRLYRSADGRIWTPLDIPELYSPRTGSVFATNDRLYVISDDKLVCSVDGLNWTILESDRPSYLGVTWQGGYFFAYFVGDDQILRSPDAVNWTTVFDEGSDYLDIKDIVYGNGVFLAAVDDFENKYPLLRSENGADWVRVDLPEGQQGEPTAILFADGKFHLTGFNNTYMVSADGLEWELTANLPRFDDLVWDGQQLWAVGSGGGVYRLAGGLPPVVTPIYDVVYEIGQPVDQDIEIAGRFDRIDVFGLPEGLSVDQTGKKIVGTPTETGDFRACMVAVSGNAISQGAMYAGLIVDSTKIPEFTEDFFVLPSGDLFLEVVDYGSGYNAFQLTSNNLPSGLQLHGYLLDGTLPAGAFPVDFTFTSFDGSVVREKQLTFFSSPLVHAIAREQPLQWRGKLGVPLTESIMLRSVVAIGSVTGLPAGLTYDSNLKLISGTPSAPGDYLITIDLVNNASNFYYKLTVEEDLNLIQPAQGVYDSQQNAITYKVQLENPSGYSFRWSYKGQPIDSDPSVSGERTSSLTLLDLSGKDPQGFSVEISKAGKVQQVDVPFRYNLDAFEDWAESVGLSGAEAGPLAYGNKHGIQNVFVFAQKNSGLDALVPPKFIPVSNGYSFQFVTDLYWSPDDWRVLLSRDLRNGFSEVVPSVIEETGSYRKWAATLTSPEAGKAFGSLKGAFFENN
ncbi:MAG: hypothetical protein KJT03_02710 [Verrucomicrobiae bacterium]|nr:hypothetical protein [Verrucomicrobiae bacterium]